MDDSLPDDKVGSPLQEATSFDTPSSPHTPPTPPSPPSPPTPPTPPPPKKRPSWRPRSDDDGHHRAVQVPSLLSPKARASPSLADPIPWQTTSSTRVLSVNAQAPGPFQEQAGTSWDAPPTAIVTPSQAMRHASGIPLTENLISEPPQRGRSASQIPLSTSGPSTQRISAYNSFLPSTYQQESQHGFTAMVPMPTIPAGYGYVPAGYGQIPAGVAAQIYPGSPEYTRVSFVPNSSIYPTSNLLAYGMGPVGQQYPGYSSIGSLGNQGTIPFGGMTGMGQIIGTTFFLIPRANADNATHFNSKSATPQNQNLGSAEVNLPGAPAPTPGPWSFLNSQTSRGQSFGNQGSTDDQSTVNRGSTDGQSTATGRNSLRISMQSNGRSQAGTSMQPLAANPEYPRFVEKMARTNSDHTAIAAIDPKKGKTLLSGDDSIVYQATIEENEPFSINRPTTSEYADQVPPSQTAIQPQPEEVLTAIDPSTGRMMVVGHPSIAPASFFSSGHVNQPGAPRQSEPSPEAAQDQRPRFVMGLVKNESNVDPSLAAIDPKTGKVFIAGQDSSDMRIPGEERLESIQPSNTPGTVFQPRDMTFPSRDIPYSGDTSHQLDPVSPHPGGEAVILDSNQTVQGTLMDKDKMIVEEMDVADARRLQQILSTGKNLQQAVEQLKLEKKQREEEEKRRKREEEMRKREENIRKREEEIRKREERNRKERNRKEGNWKQGNWKGGYRGRNMGGENFENWVGAENACNANECDEWLARHPFTVTTKGQQKSKCRPWGRCQTGDAREIGLNLKKKKKSQTVTKSASSGNEAQNVTSQGVNNSSSSAVNPEYIRETGKDSIQLRSSITPRNGSTPGTGHKSLRDVSPVPTSVKSSSKPRQLK